MINEPMPTILSGQIHVFQPATRGAASRDRMLKGPVRVVPQWKELQNQLRRRLELQKVTVPKPLWESSWPRMGGGHGAGWGTGTRSGDQGQDLNESGFLEKENGDSILRRGLFDPQAIGRLPLALLFLDSMQCASSQPVAFSSSPLFASPPAPRTVLPPPDLSSPCVSPASPPSWPGLAGRGRGDPLSPERQAQHCLPGELLPQLHAPLLLLRN